MCFALTNSRLKKDLVLACFLTMSLLTVTPQTTAVSKAVSKAWSAEETKRLNSLVHEHGTKWTRIAKLMQSFFKIREYTDAACRNHYFRKTHDCFGKEHHTYGESKGIRKQNKCTHCDQPKRGHLCQAIPRASAESAFMLLSMQK